MGAEGLALFEDYMRERVGQRMRRGKLLEVRRHGDVLLGVFDVKAGTVPPGKAGV